MICLVFEGAFCYRYKNLKSLGGVRKVGHI